MRSLINRVRQPTTNNIRCQIRRTTFLSVPHLPIPSVRPVCSTSNTPCLRQTSSNFTQMTPDSPPHSLYEAAIVKLNSLQSNALTLQKIRGQRHQMQEQNIPETNKMLSAVGITPDDLDALNVIHVSGTKGKGSTCAFTEVMIRSMGFKTGFYSSPHLVHARERIRIDGHPISEEAFAEGFFSTYERVCKAVERNPEMHMPPYFKFLTIMAMDIFIQEKVDVAIIEVGIGGQYDCTNVIRRPKVCGVTTLDFDHTSILGHSLEEIAWHKAGIFKHDVPAIVSDIVPETLKVMKKRAAELKVKELAQVPALTAYEFAGPLRAGISGEHQNVNIALALQLVRTWLRETGNEELVKFTDSSLWTPGQPFVVPRLLHKAIENCHWPGRSQIIHAPFASFFLDGAHTPKSIEMCALWFTKEANLISDRKRALVFHCTADRNPANLLPQLKDLPFDYAIFCPAVVRTQGVQDKKSDMTNFNQDFSAQITRSEQNCDVWRITSNPNTKCMVMPSVEKAIEFLCDRSSEESLDVLVTGSLHLVGAVVSVLDPELSVP